MYGIRFAKQTEHTSTKIQFHNTSKSKRQSKHISTALLTTFQIISSLMGVA